MPFIKVIYWYYIFAVFKMVNDENYIKLVIYIAQIV